MSIINIHKNSGRLPLIVASSWGISYGKIHYSEREAFTTKPRDEEYKVKQQDRLLPMS